MAFILQICTLIFFFIDLHKLNEWKTIIEQPKLPDWLGSDSEDDSGSDSESEDSEDSDEE